MMEPPLAAGGRPAEGWAPGLANKAFAVGFSRWLRDHGPLTEAGRTPCGLLGALEQERGGVVSVLGPPQLFPVPGPTACVRADGRLAHRGPVMTEPPRAAGGRRAEGWAHEY